MGGRLKKVRYEPGKMCRRRRVSANDTVTVKEDIGGQLNDRNEELAEANKRVPMVLFQFGPG